MLLFASQTSLEPWIPRTASRSLPGLSRCFPDASQMLPRCFPDASQMPPRCFPDAPRCLDPLLH